MARLYADKENSVTALTIKDGQGKAIVNAQYDKNFSVNGMPDRLNFHRPAVTIPPGAIFNGSLPPYHPDGERYQVMPFRNPGSKDPLMVMGLRHPGGNHFTVYDSTSHQPVTQLSIVTSREESGSGKDVLVSPEMARLPVGCVILKARLRGENQPKFSLRLQAEKRQSALRSLWKPFIRAVNIAGSNLVRFRCQTIQNDRRKYYCKGADPTDRIEPTGFQSIEQLRKYVRDNPVPRLVYRAHDADAEEISYSGLERNFLSDKKKVTTILQILFGTRPPQADPGKCAFTFRRSFSSEPLSP